MIPNRSVTAMLAGFLLLANVGAALYAARGIEPSSSFQTLYYVGTAWLVAWWVLADCRRLGMTVSIDHGWFVFMTWPISLPYHLFKTRGMRGWLALLGSRAMFAVTYVISILIVIGSRFR